jgi:AraC-like DNA-binding protein
VRRTAPGPGDEAAWEVARPARRARVPGVGMAGFRDRGGGAAGHRVIAHPAVTLALDFGPGALIAADATGRQQRGSLVAGLGFGADALWVRGERFEAVQVRLSPIVAGALLDVAPGDLDGAVVPLDDVWGRESSRARERLHAASSWADRFAVTDALLADRWRAASERRGRSVDREVARAWDRIVRSRGRVRVEALAAEVGWSRRRLWARFQAQLGVAPKRAARLVRFDSAVHRLLAGEPAATVAADGGYADQAHFHREVVAFTGATPAAAVGQPWLAVDGVAWPDRHAGAVSRPAPGAG